MLEANLVDRFIRSVRRASPIGLSKLAYEFDYSSGRVDVLGVTPTDELVSFEAKVIRWAVALHQAYRSLVFSHYALVVLPARHSRPALAQRNEFERFGVGLRGVENQRRWFEIEPARSLPIMPWLTAAARDYVFESRTWPLINS